MSKLNPGDLIFLVLASIVGLILFLGNSPVISGAEARLAEMAREMASSGDFLRITYHFQAEIWQPPFMVWLEAASIRLLGVNAWAVRLPAALLTLITVLLLYRYSLLRKSRLFGRLSSVLFLSCVLVLGIGRMGMDVAAVNLFLFLAISQWLKLEEMPPEQAAKDAGSWAAGFWLGLASLSGGAWILLLAWGIYLLPKIIRPASLPWLSLFKGLIGWTVLVGGWYGLQILLMGSHAFSLLEHPFDFSFSPSPGQLVLGPLLLLILGFPLTAFMLQGKASQDLDPQLHLLSITWLVFSVILSMLKPAYIFMAGIPAAWLASMSLTELLRNKKPSPLIIYISAGLSLLVLGLIPSLLNLWVGNLDLLIGGSDDPVLKGMIKMDVAWQGWEWLIGAIFLLGMAYNVKNLKEANYISFAYLQMTLSLLLIAGSSAWILPRVLQYSQGPVQDFFQKRAGSDYYLLTEGVDDALPWFYGEVKKSEKEQALDPEWLREGEVDKEVYLVASASVVDATFKSNHRGFEKLFEEGGLLFYRRRSMRPSLGTK